jgi:hypothetical protein
MYYRYLEQPHPSDQNSFRRYINMSSSAQDLSAEWKGGNLSDRVTTAPAIKQPLQAVKTSCEGISVLTVSRVGDWHGALMTLQYPVMVLDAARDVMLNVHNLGNDALPKEKCEDIVKAIQALADDTAEDWLGVGLRETFKCSPAAWASRFAIQHAISKATRTVYLSNQMISLRGLQENNKTYETLKEMVNSYIKASEPKWDGIIWPFGK